MQHNFFSVVLADKIDYIGNSLSVWLASSCPKLKVFNAVVISDSVFMMNCFKSFKFSVYGVFHNYSMFWELFVIYSNNAIPLMRRSIYEIWMIFPLIAFSEASITTKASIGSHSRMFSSPYGFIANTANNVSATFKSVSGTFFCAKTNISQKSIKVFATIKTFANSYCASKVVSVFIVNKSIYSFIQCHILSPEQKNTPTVVQEDRSLHGEGKIGKGFGNFLNAYSIA